MATQLQLRRGTSSETGSFTGAVGEVTVDTTKDTLVVHDGSTAGGFEMAKADGSNIEKLSKSGATKIQTTSGGVDVTGTVTMDGGSTSADFSFGDNDKAIFGASDDLQIYHDGGNSYVIDNGTGSLFIRGNSQIQLQDTNTAGKFFVGTAGGAATIYHNNAAKLATTSTGIDVTGNVALSGDITSTDTINIAANGFGKGVNLKRGNGAINGLSLDSNGDISFYEDTGTTPKMVWDASDQKLTIDGNGTAVTNLATAVSQAVIELNGNSNSGSDALFSGSMNASGRSYIQNANGTGSASYDLLLNPYGGFVGIGTASPAASLSLANSTNDSNGIKMQATGWGYYARSGINGTIGGQFIQSTNWNANTNAVDSSSQATTAIIQDATNGSIQFKTATTNTVPEERARLTSNGSLLVGTSNTPNGTSVYGAGLIPSSNARTQLHMATDSTGNLFHIRFYNPNGSVGDIRTNGSATVYNTSSDQRLKENIADADDAGTKVDAIQVRKYDWKADGSHQDYGMIAQELQTVAPEAVSGDADSDEMMGVDYSKLVPMLIKEIQSLRQRVASLEE